MSVTTLEALQWEYDRVCKKLDNEMTKRIWYESHWATVKRFTDEGHDILVIQFIKDSKEEP